MEMWEAMGLVAKGVAFILLIMSMWSIGVAVERIFTYTQARNQSKLFAPQVAKHLREGRLKDAIALASSKNYRYSHLAKVAVAKHLREGRLKDAIALASSKNYRYSHLAKVVLAGLQEYQFQQESGGSLSREDLLDTVRRAIQRASALTASD